MEPPTEDKEWASKYLLDPLTAPEPSQETGPGSSFITRAPSTSKGPAVTRTSSVKTPSTHSYPTPPTSASPTRSSFHPSNPYSASSSSSHRQPAFGGYSNAGPSRENPDQPLDKGKGRRRHSSLGERFPGDMSHRPLAQLRREAKAADRAPHLKRNHLPGTDPIDVLDRSMYGAAYHHDGPYDAVLAARNEGVRYPPIAAVKETNAEALRATPRENIKDSLVKHVPLQGTSVIPPGMAGLDGKEMRYTEGADLMREADAPGGAYKRWEGVKYLPEDYKGKGEPSYSVEKALKEHKLSDHRRVLSDGNSYEMQSPQNGSSFSRQRSSSGSHLDTSPSKASGNALRFSEFQDQSQSGVGRSNTTGRRVGEGLKRRFGSLRRSKKTSEVDA